MPKIVLIEPEWMEAEFAVAEIRRRIRDAEVVLFKNFSEFLLGFDDTVRDADVIITEDRLALLVPVVDLYEKIKELRLAFPKMISDGPWESDGVLRLILEHLKDKGCAEIPVLVYTHSSKDWVISQISNVDQSHVFYLEKTGSFYPLIQEIARLLKK